MCFSFNSPDFEMSIFVKISHIITNLKFVPTLLYKLVLVNVSEITSTFCDKKFLHVKRKSNSLPLHACSINVV